MSVVLILEEQLLAKVDFTEDKPSEHFLRALFLINQFVEVHNNFLNHHSDRVFVVADRGMVAVFYAHKLVRSFWLLHASLTHSCWSELVVFKDLIVSNYFILFRLNHQNGQNDVLNLYFCQSLFFSPKNTKCRGEVTLAFWVVFNVTPSCFVLWIQLLKLWRNLLLRAYKLVELDKGLVGIKFFSPTPVEWSQKANPGKHCLTDYTICHICGYKSSKRTTKEEQRSFLLVNLVFADGFIDEQPLIVVDVICLLDDISLSLTVTKASLVYCKDFEVLIRQTFSNSTIGLSVWAETVNIEHHRLSVVFGRVSVCPEFDLFAELDDREV